jgi:hypothetical protein
MRDSKGEAAVTERPMTVVADAAKDVPEATKADNSRDLVAARLKLHGAAPMPSTELDGDAKRRRR